MSTGFETDRKYTATEYNAKNQWQLLKCLRTDLKSPQYEYTWNPNQINVLKYNERFNPSGSCIGGGLYFCNDLKSLSKFASELICLVSIPENARVWIENGKAKTDQLFLKATYTNLEFVKGYFSNTLLLDKPLNEISYFHKFLSHEDCIEILEFLQTIPGFETNPEVELVVVKLFSNYPELLTKHLANIYKPSFTDLFELAILNLLRFFGYGLLQNKEGEIIKYVESATNYELRRVLSSDIDTFDNEPILNALATACARRVSVSDILKLCNASLTTRIFENALDEMFNLSGKGSSEVVKDLLKYVACKCVHRPTTPENSTIDTRIISVTLKFAASQSPCSSTFAQTVNILISKGFTKEELISFVTDNKHLIDEQKARVLSIINKKF